MATSKIRSNSIADNTIVQEDVDSNYNNLLVRQKKNLIINGNFDVWQRGTNIAVGASIIYTADRWLCGGQAVTVERSLDVPNNRSNYSALHTISATIFEFFQTVELNATGLALPFKTNTDYTISFWIKTQSAQNIEILTSYADDGVGNGSVAVGALSTTPVAGGVWERIVHTFNTGATTPSGTSLGLICIIRTTTTMTGTVNITQVQIEEGSVATDFEQRSYGEELALCKRYYEVSSTAASQGIMATYMMSTTSCRGVYTFNVEKRVSPTVTFSAPTEYVVQANGGDNNISSITSSNVNTKSCRVSIVGSGLVTGHAGILMGKIGSTAPGIYVDAEL